MFSKNTRKVFLVVSITKKNNVNGEELLIVAPKILESFELVENKLIRKTSNNIQLLKSVFKNNSEQLIITVDFFSIDKTQANAFTKGLKSLGSAYLRAGTTVEASKVVIAAMDVIGNVLFEDNEVYLTYTGGIKVNNATSFELYFDDSGNINDKNFISGESSANIFFNISSTQNFFVNFDFNFENQGINTEEKKIYNELLLAKGAVEKRKICFSLRDCLKKRFSNDTVLKLLAIAINDIRWAQDETSFYCITPEQAIDLKNNYPLPFIANCTSETCVKTKKIFCLLKGNAPPEVIKSITGGVDIYSMGCQLNTNSSRIINWSNVRNDYADSTFQSYIVNTCLSTSDGNYAYEHTLNWLDGELVSHSCNQQNISEKCD